jgi:CheY-like chemotaxis protein
MNLNRSDILVVDDSETNIVLLEAVLREAGWSVRAAQSGSEALKMIKSRVPDLILLDLLMPEIDGYQILEKLKADNKLSNIPVIVISAINDPETREKCARSGATDYMPKPVSLKELEAKVRGILG